MDILKALPSQYDKSKSKLLPPHEIDQNITTLQPTSALVVREPGVVNETTTMAAIKKITRIDLYQRLLDVYEHQRFRWVEFMRLSRPKGKATAEEIDGCNTKSCEKLHSNRLTLQRNGGFLCSDLGRPARRFVDNVAHQRSMLVLFTFLQGTLVYPTRPSNASLKRHH